MPFSSLSARAASGVSAACLLTGASVPGGAQPRPAPTAASAAVAAPAVVTPSQFARLGWLAGRWRGRMAGGESFYEEYRFRDDSTLEVRTFADGSFGAVTGTDSIVLRRGGVGYGASVVTAMDGERVTFAHGRDARQGFTFLRTGGERWSATIRGPGRTTVYAMERAAARPAAQGDDRAAVRRAVLDYVEGFYEGDTTKLVRSVWPEARKYGYARSAGGYRGMAMPFPAGFVEYANGVRSGRHKTPPGARKDITLFDVQDQTASAKLAAWWGTDYLLLAKAGGRWQITHVLWQSTPPGAR